MEIGSQITFGGLATGLDTRAIIDALLSVEQIPIIRLQNKKTVLSRQDDIYSQIDSRLDDLRTLLESLDTA
ncbi:MAG: flagellar cap protein FliD, partial [Planctomycetes bacterium]|nr:flagellar cap protein FliD [Planctomycetota bacterium]